MRHRPRLPQTRHRLQGPDPRLRRRRGTEGCRRRTGGPFKGQFDAVAGVEARGFLLAAAAAYATGTGVITVRKAGKLPREVVSEDYALEYGSATLELHTTDLAPGSRVLILDDVLATGGTLGAAARLFERCGDPRGRCRRGHGTRRTRRPLGPGRPPGPLPAAPLAPAAAPRPDHPARAMDDSADPVDCLQKATCAAGYDRNGCRMVGLSFSIGERSMHDADLAHERDYVAGLYARLDELRAEKRAQLAQVRRAGAVGTMQNVSERDAFAALYEDRLAQLDAVDDRLVFGRLDLDSGEAQYIGRIGLTTDDLQRLMLDWRAPEAGHFYQATAFDRQGVRRRRHLILQGREVKAIEDDVLDADMLADNDSLQGEGALLAALNSKRTGRMSDIVGTIQSEQDRIIRSSISGALVVQGGPGTGKTAVALHRAAYLLYTHRDRLKTAGVLLVGPSSSFMKYIERVLPSLGETGVVMASVGRLMPGIHAVAEPEADVAAIKGRLDMAEVVANAVANRQRIPAGNRILEVDGRKLVLTPRQVRRARDRARSTGKPHNEARVSFVKILLRELTEQMTELVEAGSIGNNADRSYLAEDVRSARDVRIALNLCWMPMTPEKLIGELLSKPAILEACTPNLSPAERALLLRPADAPVDRGRRAAAGRGRRTARRARRGRRHGDWPSRNTTAPATSPTPSRRWSTWKPPAWTSWSPPRTSWTRTRSARPG